MINIIFDYYDDNNNLQRLSYEIKFKSEALELMEHFIEKYDNLQITLMGRYA